MIDRDGPDGADDQEKELPPWKHRFEIINGLRFHFVEAGTGPLIMLLHGFPECWYSWRRQIPALAAAGWNVVALDLRGYNETEKPRGARNYRLELLVADVAQGIKKLSKQSGKERAVIVGHDWGGAIAWTLAMRHPELVEKLIVLNAPHPAAFLRELRTVRQCLRSWYMLFFQCPWLPEWMLRAGDYALLKRGFRRQPVHSGTLTEHDLEQYRNASAQPGALSAALNYYRAAFRYPGQLKGLWFPACAGMTVGRRTIPAPTLLIWGEQDPFLGIRLTEGLDAWAPNLRIERIPDASHWVQNDMPERVNELMLEFLAYAF